MLLECRRTYLPQNDMSIPGVGAESLFSIAWHFEELYFFCSQDILFIGFSLSPWCFRYVSINLLRKFAFPIQKLCAKFLNTTFPSILILNLIKTRLRKNDIFSPSHEAWMFENK